MMKNMKKIMLAIAAVSCLYTAQAMAMAEFAQIMRNPTLSNQQIERAEAIIATLIREGKKSVAEQFRGQLFNRVMAGQNIKRLQAQLEELQSLRQATSVQEEELSTSAQSSEKEIAQLENTIKELNAQLQAKEQQLNKQLEQQKRTTRSVQEFQDANMDLQNQIDDLKKLFDQQQETLIANKVELQQKNDRLNALQKENIEISSLHERIKNLTEQVASEQESKRKLITGLQKDREQYMTENDRLQTELNNLTNEILKQRDELGSLRSQREENQKLNDQLKQAQAASNAMRQQNITLTLEHNQLTANNARLRNTNVQNNKEIAALTKRANEQEQLRLQAEQQATDNEALRNALVENTRKNLDLEQNYRDLLAHAQELEKKKQTVVEKVVERVVEKPAPEHILEPCTKCIGLEEENTKLLAEIEQLRQQQPEEQKGGLEMSSQLRELLTTLLRNNDLLEKEAEPTDEELVNIVNNNLQVILNFINTIPELQEQLQLTKGEMTEIRRAILGFRAYVREKNYWKKIGETLLRALENQANTNQTIGNIARRFQGTIAKWQAKLAEIENLPIQKFTHEEINRILETYIQQLGLTESTLEKLGESKQQATTTTTTTTEQRKVLHQGAKKIEQALKRKQSTPTTTTTTEKQRDEAKKAALAKKGKH